MPTLLFALVITLVLVASARATPMPKDLKWEKRILIVAAPSAGDEKVRTQLDRFRAGAAELKDRDLVLYAVLGESGSFEGDVAENPGKLAHDIRKQFNIPADSFRVLLIGKDGGVKMERSEPVETGELFELIDSMPMRQQEMQRDGQ